MQCYILSYKFGIVYYLGIIIILDLLLNFANFCGLG